MALLRRTRELDQQHATEVVSELFDRLGQARYAHAAELLAPDATWYDVHASLRILDRDAILAYWANLSFQPEVLGTWAQGLRVHVLSVDHGSDPYATLRRTTATVASTGVLSVETTLVHPS